jgi:hypothetical protein
MLPSPQKSMPSPWLVLYFNPIFVNVNEPEPEPETKMKSLITKKIDVYNVSSKFIGHGLGLVHVHENSINTLS